MAAELRSQFTSSVRTGIVPLEVNFINQSSGPYISCKWEFGDGAISNEVNPTHQYLQDGTFQTRLTIYDAYSANATSISTITVYSEIDQSSSAATQQQSLFTYKRFEPGQVNVIKRTQAGSNFNTNSPMSSTTNLNIDRKCVFSLLLDSTEIADSENAVVLDSQLDEAAFAVNFSSADEIYYALLVNHSGTTSGATWSQRFNYSSYSACPIIFYKETGAYGSNTLTTDRNFPNIAAPTGRRQLAYAFLDKWSGGTNWAANGNCDFTVPKMQTAIDSYGSLETTGLTEYQVGKGSLSYLGYDIGTGQTIAALMPHNSATSTSQAFYPGTVAIFLPWVMWHKQTTPGLTLYDYADETEREETSSLRFRYLRDGLTTSNNIVGKVFYDKKMIVISDVELVAALSFNSNRNWTLGQPSVSVSNVGNGWTNSALTYYVTYRILESTGVASNTKYGLGALPPIHCRYVQKITPVNYANLRLEAPVSPWFNSNNTTNSTGFAADAPVQILIATGDTTAPNENSWRYSATSTYYSGLSAGININFSWTGMTAYQLDTTNKGNANMTLGREFLTLAYISGTYESNIYKMAATCVAKNTEFNNTQNSTFDSGTNDSVYITEAALYNENNELLMIGKLSQPLEKNNQKYLTVKMEIDL